MADQPKPQYSSLLDQFLDDVEPDFGDIGLKGPMDSGEAFKSLSRDEADMSFLDGIAGHSKHQTALGQVTAGYTPRQLNNKIEDTNDNALGEAFQTITKAEKTDYQKKSLSDKEIETRLRLLLNLGYTPEKIAGYMKKLADLNIMDNSHTSMGADFAKTYSSGLGMAYMEPNFYMKSCDQSFEKVKKEGNLRALSVKKVAACNGCKYNNCGSCSLYSRPIVASSKELEQVIKAELTRKNIKCASLKEGLTKLASGGEKIHTPSITASPNTGEIRTAGDKNKIIKKEATAEEIGVSLQAGIPLSKVFKSAAAVYGKGQVVNAVKRYIASLKQSKAKVIISSLDCSYLKGKLAASNPIIGASKCGSCTYRDCMHCGLTGGTLISFPGMNRVATKKIGNEGEAVDGQQMLKEWELDVKDDTPLDIREPEQAPTDVELSSSSRIDVE